VVTPPGELTLDLELGRSLADVAPLATAVHDCDDLTAPIASGSFSTAGMVVVPCSIRSLSAIAHSYDHNLLARAADVTLKEGRPLVLVVRETPLHLGHLRLMVQAAELGAVIFPPMPAFYAHPRSLDDLVDQTVGRVVDRLGFPNRYYRRWTGDDEV
jgi:4-hydroxy-3-polyprenylbenzoate decarboxylase